jgi:hypothetical protein
VEVLPHASVAVQVRVRVKFCGQEPGTVASTKVRLGAGSQVSVAVGVLKGSGIPQATVEAGPTPEMVGALLSCTVMSCWQTTGEPQLSDAVQVRVMILALPQTGVVASLNVKFSGQPQGLVPVGEPVFAGSVLAGHWMVISGGH